MSEIGGIGVDLCEIARMAELLQTPFLTRYFTPVEVAYIHGKGQGAAQTMAGIWAAKEAALKALGVGIRLPLKDIGIIHSEGGQPRYQLMGEAAALLAGGRLHLSISHEGSYAVAMCVWEKALPEGDSHDEGNA